VQFTGKQAGCQRMNVSSAAEGLQCVRQTTAKGREDEERPVSSRPAVAAPRECRVPQAFLSQPQGQFGKHGRVALPMHGVGF
jgi:hypothetical protein